MNVDNKEKKYTERDMIEFAKNSIFKSLLYGENCLNEKDLIQSLIVYNKGKI